MGIEANACEVEVDVASLGHDGMAMVGVATSLPGARYNKEEEVHRMVSFELPPQVEQDLRRRLGDLDRAAKEAFLVEAYRCGRLSHHELSLALGCDRLEAEAVLHKYNVTEDLGTVEDYLADARALEELRATKR